ncbi:MAG: PDZ domain-containing protein [Planctomycetota bacterium]
MIRLENHLRAVALAAVGLVALATPTLAHSDSDEVEETLLLQSPTVSSQHIVFVYAQDLWVVGRDGGDARRLTSNPGVETSPQISPDGEWVAFSGQYDGNTDVYVIPIEGGNPRRLTWHPGSDNVADWHPDGQRILFVSGRNALMPSAQLYLVDRDDPSGLPEQLPLPKVAHASYDDDASHIVYTPIADAFGTWKRYRGGRIPPVWIYDTSTHDVEVVPHVRASDTYPNFLAGQVYFASDRDGVMNLYRYRPGSGSVEQLTHFADFDIRSIDAGGNALVFEQGGAIHELDPATGEIERLSIRVRADGLAARARWQEVGRGSVRSASIAPNGQRAVFEARGEIITLPREHGDPRNLTQSPGVHERSPAWSPDGEKIAWFSDESGEYQLYVGDRLGREKPKAFELGNAGDTGGFYNQPTWSPDGKHIAFYDKFNRLAYVTLESGEVQEVARPQGSLGELRPGFTWSPDSKWIAFENRNPRTLFDHIALYELETKETTSVTDDFAYASSPAFSQDQKHLFFFASVDAGPTQFGLDMSVNPGDFSGNLYVAVLQQDGEHPLAPRSDEAIEKKKDDAKKKEEKEEDKKEESEEKKDEATDAPSEGAELAQSEEKKDDAEKKKGKDLPGIDTEGLGQRILALPIPAGRYGNLASLGSKLLYMSVPQGGQSELMSFDFKERKTDSIDKGINGFDISADGKWMLTSARGQFEIRNAAGKDAKALAIDKVKVKVDPTAEWPQILREVWRIERDYFYDPNMHGVDWPAMWERWSAFLPHVKHRDDLNMIIGELIGELACGHNYRGGGERPDAPDGISVGLLGCDFEVDGDRYKITRILQGQNWNPDLRAPLTEPGVDVNEGDYLISVNGRPVTATDNLYEVFENTADQQVSLTVSGNADGSDSRNSTVVPLRSEGSLRRLTWIEQNRQRVEEKSGGRLAYVYMPNTGSQGKAAFDRDFFSQIDKHGLILDERYNGGGKVADYVIETLSREPMSYWMNREGWVGRTPFGMMAGPKVMVINEYAGSGGDWMPWAFQKEGVGELVGTRTWGGLVGISGYPPLMDGGMVTAASFGVMDTEGNWAVENEGVSPDHEVIEYPKSIIEDGADPQLDKAIELALKALEANPPKELPGYKPPAKR